MMNDVETQVLFITNLPKKIEKSALLDMFSKFGDLMQIRIGNMKNTEGTAFIIFRRLESAKKAHKCMNGYSFENRFIHVRYWQPVYMISKRI